MKTIVEAKALAGYRLWLRFKDGFEGVADLSDLAGRGVFPAWNTPGVFANVKVTEFGAVAWNDQLDLCPDSLYLRITGQSPEEFFTFVPTTAHA